MLRKLHSAHAILEARGVSGLAFRAAQIVFGTQNVEWFLLVETDGRGATTRISDSAITPEWLSDPREASFVARLHGDPDTVAQRLSGGQRVACYIVDGAVVAYLWFAHADSWDENGITFTLGPDEVWAIDGFVDPDRRGESIHARLFLGAVEALRREGIARVVSTVDVVNTASIRSLHKRSGRVMGTALMVKIGNIALGHYRRSWYVRKVPVVIDRRLSAVARGDRSTDL